MRHFARIVTIVGLLAVLTPAAVRAQIKASPPAAAATPREGVLLLKNGQLLAGRITWSGDHYFVDRGGLQMGVRAAEVELTARDLDDAYQQKRAKVAKDDLDGCLKLAQWCLRHELLGYAATQLAECEVMYPRHPRTEILMRQLQSAVRVKSQNAAPDNDSPAKRATGDTSETAKQATTDEDASKNPGKADSKADSPESKLMDTLSSDTLETFVTTIQPMLINNCATGGCHGGASSAELKFHRFDPRRSPSRVYTERNLAAVLKHIDRDHPENSRLLVAPSQPHGRAKTAVFAGRSLEQRAELAAWIHRVAGRQAAANAAAKNAPANKSRRNAASSDRGVRLAGFDDPATGKTNPTAAADQRAEGPSNPHDPSVFNRRYFPKGPRSYQGDRADDPINDADADFDADSLPLDGDDREPAALPAAPQKEQRPRARPRATPQTRSPRRPSIPNHVVPGQEFADDDIPPFESIEEGEITGQQPRQ